MKTARERAEEWLIKNCENYFIPEDIESLEILLKDIAKLTRHACAEAVSQCKTIHGDRAIYPETAHNACMNVKAV